MNGQVERMNGMILQGIKSRIFNKLNKFGGRWMAEPPTVLWSLRMTPRQATGHMPFFMVYRDGNGAPIPNSPWGIPLLGDGDGTNSIPIGI